MALSISPSCTMMSRRRGGQPVLALRTSSISLSLKRSKKPQPAQRVAVVAPRLLALLQPQRVVEPRLLAGRSLPAA